MGLFWGGLVLLAEAACAQVSIIMVSCRALNVGPQVCGPCKCCEGALVCCARAQCVLLGVFVYIDVRAHIIKFIIVKYL